jgi:hypothetical protein
LVNPCLALMVPRRVTKYVAPCLSEPAKWRLAARMAFGGGEVRRAPVALTSHTMPARPGPARIGKFRRGFLLPYVGPTTQLNIREQLSLAGPVQGFPLLRSHGPLGRAP